MKDQAFWNLTIFKVELAFLFGGVDASLWTHFNGFDYRSISECQSEGIFFPDFSVLQLWMLAGLKY